MCGSRDIRHTATAAFIHCVYVCQYEGMRDLLSLAYFIPQNGKEVFLAKEKYLPLWQALYFELFKNHSV